MVIALLSDFGLSDHYVGAIKGVLAKMAPNAKVVDISHQVPPFDKIHGGTLLYQSFRYFPRHSIFLAVVDPGVGGSRKAILVETEDYYFLAPDNGLLTMALGEQKIRRIVQLNKEKYFLTPLSSTFHGRDIFAPVAAHLAQGLGAEFFGEELTGYERLPDFVPNFGPGGLNGQILTFDRFGNAISNLSRTFLQRHHHGPDWTLSVGSHQMKGMQTHYAAVPPGEALFLFGSGNLLEIAVHQGSAEQKLGLKRGDPIHIPL